MGCFFSGKQTRGACGRGRSLLSPQRKDALLAEAVPASRLVGVAQDPVAVGALVPLLQALHKPVVGVGLEIQGAGAGGVLAREDARESSGFVTGHGSCTGKRSRHGEKLFKHSLAATLPRLPLAAGCCCWQEGSHLQRGTGFRGKHGASYGRTIKHSQNHKTKITLQASQHTSLEKSFS